ncbi:MAG: Tricorn protease [Gemmatimonadaceae bacterium]|nr:Tricorn protease [Gemmatimonadaceae bacterium]
MRTASRTTALLALIAAPALAQSRPTAVPRSPLAQPGISPDGSEIALVSAGDIWAVSSRGGEARLLIAHPASDERPLYSPDGTRIAFMSNRAGSMDIWLLTLASGQLRRLTFDDGTESLDGWSGDGSFLYYSTSAHDIAGMNDVYRVSAKGGTPMPVAADRYASEFMSAPSADGQSIAIVARGMALSQWWRKGHSHLDESEVWLVRPGTSGAPSYEKLLPRGAKQQWPMWNRSGSAPALTFVSDRSGAQNLWTKPLQGDAQQLTRFTSGRVMWPTMANTGQIAFERDFGIWLYDPVARTAHEVPITLRGAATVDQIEHLSLNTNFADLAVAPDGKKLAFTAHGEVFAVSATDGGDATRITRTPAAESQVTWSGDSKRIAYSSNRAGAWQVYVYEFATGVETQVSEGVRNSSAPRFSPDGKALAFIRDGSELCVASLDPQVVRVVATGIFGRPPMMPERAIAWSPDSRWIAYLSGGTKLFMNAYVVPAAGGDARQVSWLSNTRANTVSWSGDGTFLLLDTGMRTEPGLLARIDLLPHTPKFREDQFVALFRDDTPGRTTPPTPAPAIPTDSSTSTARPSGSGNVRIEFDGIRRRLSIVPAGVDVETQTLSPDGKTAIVRASVGNQQHLFSYSLDELAAEPPATRQLTTTAGNKTLIQFAGDGKTIWFLEGGRVTSVNLDSRQARTVAVRAELDVDFGREKWEVFHQAWEYLNDNFYDPDFHGIDWKATRAAYAPYVAGSRTPDEMRRVLSLMIGEMNASHMGIGSPPAGIAPSTGRLGIEFDPAAYDARGQLRVASLVPLGPAAVAGGIRAGDLVLAIDGVPVTRDVSLDSLLAYKIGRKVVVTVAGDANGRDRRDVNVRAVASGAEKGLLYRAWVDERRALVASLSKGRLGYAHMLDMGGGAIAQLNLDLDADDHENDAIVLDIRNNNGGFVNGYALDILSRKPYVDMVRRGVPSVPGRPVLGQRALEAPTILVTNQATLSDGENFTEGYRTMGLGKVVGEPTAGWDVYTGSGTMVDGTTVRLPFMRNAQLDQAALELIPRKVDIPIDRPMGESYSGRDTQLETAVSELLKQIGSSRNRAVQLRQRTGR